MGGGEGGEGEEVRRELAKLNGVYEERFPGLRYVYVDLLFYEGKQGRVLLVVAGSWIC